MPTEQLLVDLRDRVLYLTLNRPEKLNALGAEMVAGLIAELERAATDPEVGAVVVTGAGRGFCAGGDVGAMRSGSEAGPSATLNQNVARLRRSEEAALLLHEIPKVTIAAINGAVAGAGLGVALACDLRIASDQARFTTAFGRVGYSGDFGGTYLLTQLAGTAKARELYFLSEMIDSAEALRLGIVNRVVAADSLMAEVSSVAGRIAHGPLVAYAYMKSNLNLALRSDLRSMLEREALTQTLASATEDHREGVQAFLEKREPKFQGR